MFIFTDDKKSIKPLKSLRWHEIYFLSFLFCLIHDILFFYFFRPDKFDLREHVLNAGTFAGGWLTLFIIISLRTSKPHCFFIFLILVFQAFGAFLLIFNASHFNLTLYEKGRLVFDNGSITEFGWTTLVVHPPLISAGILSAFLLLKTYLLEEINKARLE